MRNSQTLFVCLLILLGFLSFSQIPPAAAAAQAVVTDVDRRTVGGSFRFALKIDRPLSFRLFTLADPYRIVLDLPEVGWRLPARPLPGADGAFKRLRYGLYRPGNSRVVLDFAQPVGVTDAFVASRAQDGYQIVVVAGPTTRDRFLAGVSLPPREVTGLRAAGAGKLTATQKPRKPSTAKAPVAPDPDDGGRLGAVTRRSQALFGDAGQPPSPARAVAARPAPAHYLPMPPRRPGSLPVNRRPMIVIDPGHGGVDPGAVAPGGVYEKHIVLALSRELRRQLLATRRYRAVLTRNRDIFIRLRDRVAIARDKNADLFISVHADSIRNRRVSGPSVYTLSEKASDKEAAELAERENKADLIAGVDLTHESADVTNILIDLAQRETMNQSARFAAYLVRSLGQRTRVLTRPHRFAGFAVLKAPDLPSVLLETGFLSNGEDARRLTSKAYRRRLAGAIVDAIERYFASVEQANVRGR